MNGRIPGGKTRLAIAALALAPLAATAAAQSGPAPAAAPAAAVVAVTGGEVRGSMVDGALVFRGIPYAAPPLGALRWRPPAPVVAWSGTLDATRPAASCLQNDENWNHQDWLRGSEDCLTLNVRTAALAGKRPVMVWIHGGSNRAGSAFGPVESHIDAGGVVVVSLQYRLGILGFLSHRALVSEQGGSSGNYGLMDQIAALQWVHDNIARFGGDPEQVTIFGESAGSQDVSLLLAAPAARGLFRAAIMQSGTPGFGMPPRPLDEALRIGDQLDGLAGSGGDIARLRALSPLALFAMQSQLKEDASQGNSFLFLRTTVDGKVLPDAPERLLAAAPRLPVIIGTNTIEFGPGPGGAELAAFSRFWFAGNAAPALAAYQAEEARGPDPRRGNLELRMQTDAQFHCPANRLATLLATRGWPVWRYEFDVGENMGGRNDGLTRHALDVGYVFGGQPVGGGVKMLDYWTALAVSGDVNAAPVAAPRPRWPRLDPRRPQTLKFGARTTTVQPGQPREAFCGWSGNF